MVLSDRRCLLPHMINLDASVQPKGLQPSLIFDVTDNSCVVSPHKDVMSTEEQLEAFYSEKHRQQHQIVYVELLEVLASKTSNAPALVNSSPTWQTRICHDHFL